MLNLEEILAVLKMRMARGRPMVEGSCFGVKDPGELRSTTEKIEEPPLRCNRCGSENLFADYAGYSAVHATDKQGRAYGCADCNRRKKIEA